LRSSQDFQRHSLSYSLHKPKRKKFIRKKIIVPGIDYLWQIDLLDVSKIKDENDNYRYFLTVIDCFSKFAWVEPIKNNQGLTDLEARVRVRVRVWVRVRVRVRVRG